MTALAEPAINRIYLILHDACSALAYRAKMGLAELGTKLLAMTK